jgi:hypothetical protein
MPIYFFEIADANPPIPCVGENLSSLDDARCFALKYAAALLCEQKEPFWNGDVWVMTVTDANRLTLFTLMIYVTAAPSTLKLQK